MTKEERERRENCRFEFSRISWENWDGDEPTHDFIMGMHERAGVYTRYADEQRKKEQQQQEEGKQEQNNE